MGWGDKVGRHEGYVVCVFADGRIGGGMESGGIPVFGDDGQSQLDGKGNAVETRPAAAVIGWRVACSHAPSNVSDDDLSDWYGEADFWTGPSLWRRVYSPAQEDLSTGRICVPLGGGGGDIVVEGGVDVHELMFQEWRTHVVPEEHTRSIRNAFATIADAARTVDLEVAAARAAGLVLG